MIRRKRKFRRGVAAVETAAVLPVLAIVFLGIVESNRAVWAKTSTTQAAFEGGRLASHPGFTAAEVIERCNQFMADRDLASTVEVVPSNLSSLLPGDRVTVTVSVSNDTGQISIVRPSSFTVSTSLVVLRE